MTKAFEVLQLQESMKNAPQVPLHVDHYFSEGLYGRLMVAEANTVIVGAKHRKGHMAILLEGSVLVSDKYGSAQYVAPYIILSIPGDKRAFTALTRVKWMTIHSTTETDVAKLEKTLVEGL